MDLEPGTFTLSPGFSDGDAGHFQNIPCERKTESGMLPDTILENMFFFPICNSHPVILKYYDKFPVFGLTGGYKYRSEVYPVTECILKQVIDDFDGKRISIDFHRRELCRDLNSLVREIIYSVGDDDCQSGWYVPICRYSLENRSWQLILSTTSREVRT
jgi:hypothetical protein